MNLQQTITRFQADTRYAVEQDEAILWADTVQNDIFNLDIPLLSVRATLETTDGTLKYALTEIAADVRKIGWMRYKVTTSDVTDYDKNIYWGYQYYEFDSNDTDVWFTDDPDGRDIEVNYYRTPTLIDDINDSIDLPTRWKRGIYLGMMQMAQERKHEVPSGNWFQMYENFKEGMKTNEKSKDKGAQKVAYYNILSE